MRTIPLLFADKISPPQNITSKLERNKQLIVIPLASISVYMLQFGHELNNLRRTNFLNMRPCEGALRVAASDWSSLSFMQNAV